MTDDQAAFAVAPPDPQLRRLEPLLGTWRSEGQTRASILGPGVRTTGPTRGRQGLLRGRGGTLTSKAPRAFSTSSVLTGRSRSTAMGTRIG
jgi:hypothetical protein